MSSLLAWHALLPVWVILCCTYVFSFVKRGVHGYGRIYECTRVLLVVFTKMSRISNINQNIKYKPNRLPTWLPQFLTRKCSYSYHGPTMWLCIRVLCTSHHALDRLSEQTMGRSKHSTSALISTDDLGYLARQVFMIIIGVFFCLGFAQIIKRNPRMPLTYCTWPKQILTIGCLLGHTKKCVFHVCRLTRFCRKWESIFYSIYGGSDLSESRGHGSLQVHTVAWVSDHC